MDTTKLIEQAAVLADGLHNNSTKAIFKDLINLGILTPIVLAGLIDHYESTYQRMNEQLDAAHHTNQGLTGSGDYPLTGW
jgi:hypothetical protein